MITERKMIRSFINTFNFLQFILRNRFGEHRRAIENKTDHAVPEHFNQPGHHLKDIELIPLKLINTKTVSIRRARERLYI